MISNRLKIAIFLIHTTIMIFGMRSCVQEGIKNIKFHKVRSCEKSEGAIISRANFKTVQECQKFARQKNALALNYSPAGARSLRRGGLFFNCHVLGCPESANLSTLVKDPEFDYYSLYGNHTALEDSFCVKSVGIFRLVKEKQNYSTAIDSCQQIGGDLAHIVSETRTTTLANYMANVIFDWYKGAYVGLDDMRIEGEFETPLGDSLSCYKYRAWGPGHPRNRLKGDDCVIMDAQKTWRVVNCGNKLPYLCEYYPSAPVANQTRFVQEHCDDYEDEDEWRECRRRNSKRLGKWSRCYK